METTIEVNIAAVHRVTVIDTVNETLRQLAMDGHIDDQNDMGWEWCLKTKDQDDKGPVISP